MDVTALRQFLLTLLDRLRPRRLQVQVAILGALLLTIVVTAVTSYTIQQQTGQEVAALESRVRALAQNVATATASYVVTQRYSEIEELLRRMVEFPGIRRLQVANQQGRVMSHVVRVGSTTQLIFDTTPLAPPANPHAVERDETRLVVWEPVNAGTPIGWVRIEYSLAEIAATETRIRNNGILIAVFSIAASVLLFLLFLRRPVRAVERATLFAAHLDALRGERFIADRGTYELERLGEALNNASLKLKDQERTIADRSRRLQAVLEHAIDGIVTLDLSGRIETSNRAVGRLFGYETDALIGRRFEHLVPTLAIDAPDGPAALLGSATAYLEYDVNARRQDGSEFPVHVGLSRMPLEDRVLLVALIRDVTEQKRLDRLKDDFIDAVSHELRTPLTSLRGALELLAGDTNALDAETRNVVAIAHKNSERLAQIVSDILDFENLESGQVAFVLEDTDLAATVREALTRAETQTQRQRVPLALDIATEPLPVKADRRALVRAVNNLLINAVRRSAPGDTVQVWVGLHAAMAQVRVIDRGPAISEAFRPYVFQKFVQTDSQTLRYTAGTALSLNIAKAIVERLGGRIDLSQQHGETVFFIEFPLSQTQTSAPRLRTLDHP
jgi:PAS domain S-box-containing protein